MDPGSRIKTRAQNAPSLVGGAHRRAVIRVPSSTRAVLPGCHGENGGRLITGAAPCIDSLLWPCYWLVTPSTTEGLPYQSDRSLG